MIRGATSYQYFDEPYAWMAHRGGYVSGEDASRENTLHAFAQAVELGYRYLESDVHATSDGYLIAFHDQVLDRVTDATGVVAELGFDQVRAARIAGRDQIPTLDEVLESFPGVRINIDIKAPGAIEPLVATIKAHRAQQRVCVSSFNAARLTRFRRLMGSGVATGFASPGVAWAAFVPVLPRMLPLAGQVFQVPLTTQVAGRTVRVLTPRLMASARAHDVRVHVWTVNEPAQMAELIGLGVDGLITDRTDVLKRVASSHGLWND
ncbi:MAG: glycerophosphodiester phosphodiesterase [Brooklawnia sp.]